MNRPIFRLKRAAANLLLSTTKVRNSAAELFGARHKYYAEYLIDRRIRREFFPDFETTGCMVEVGCAGPELLSMSRHFRESGWRCIGIEPNPKFAALHRASRYEVYEYAAADFNADRQDFVVVEASSDYAGTRLSAQSYSSLKIKPQFEAFNDGALDMFEKSHIQVKVRRLDEILALHCPDLARIDLVTVDVEGYEMEVMRGFTPSRFGSPVIVLENLFHDIDYHSYMRSIGYHLQGRSRHNYIYVPANHSCLHFSSRRSS